jgi:hypothetical protein
MKSGWRGESKRHSIARKYGRASAASHSKVKEAVLYSLVDTAYFWPMMWEQNKGIFYRGVAGDAGMGFGEMGTGIYVSWKEGMARAFAKMSYQEHKGSTGEARVIKYYLPKELKLLDWESNEAWEFRKKLGVQDRYSHVADPMYSRLLTESIKKAGYDGVISSDVATGIVIFDSSKIKVVD